MAAVVVMLAPDDECFRADEEAEGVISDFAWLL
jgi:hypothetical protein